ncbi:uncharacterized protein BCR38DRAFT_404336 [Pseudomassariella vexata]|uniref:Uncharacterized protein n=1 Tax=Pseudomassariella vexata TaxID=1141098 RepID=A0A1Y2EI34_9PEZI|nr:uncharacterized protein BCR38DRAFT_404336 [Pseudomassariella vexata]ORY71223.1 hypothetical protein BCR38DRAFT_404336 [Pseudomassariella vexata]
MLLWHIPKRPEAWRPRTSTQTTLERLSIFVNRLDCLVITRFWTPWQSGLVTLEDGWDQQSIGHLRSRQIENDRFGKGGGGGSQTNETHETNKTRWMVTETCCHAESQFVMGTVDSRQYEFWFPFADIPLTNLVLTSAAVRRHQQRVWTIACIPPPDLARFEPARPAGRLHSSEDPRLCGLSVTRWRNSCDCAMPKEKRTSQSRLLLILPVVDTRVLRRIESHAKPMRHLQKSHRIAWAACHCSRPEQTLGVPSTTGISMLVLVPSSLETRPGMGATLVKRATEHDELSGARSSPARRGHRIIVDRRAFRDTDSIISVGWVGVVPSSYLGPRRKQNVALQHQVPSVAQDMQQQADHQYSCTIILPLNNTLNFLHCIENRGGYGAIRFGTDSSTRCSSKREVGSIYGGRCSRQRKRDKKACNTRNNAGHWQGRASQSVPAYCQGSPMVQGNRLGIDQVVVVRGSTLGCTICNNDTKWLNIKRR